MTQDPQRTICSTDMADWLPPPIPSRWQLTGLALRLCVAFPLALVCTVAIDLWSWLREFDMHETGECFREARSLIRRHTVRKEWARHHWGMDRFRAHFFNAPKCLYDEDEQHAPQTLREGEG